MNSYERVMAGFAGQMPDSIPVVPSIREWCTVQAGVNFLECIERAEPHVYAQTYCQKHFGYDIVWDLQGIHAESEAMGSKISFPDGFSPFVEQPAVEDYGRDLPGLKLFDPYTAPRLKLIMEGVRRLKEMFAGTVPVLGYVQAPFRHACMLRGAEAAMRDCMKNPEPLRELCELALASQIIWGNALVSAGADVLFVSDPMSSGDAVSPRQWKQWGLPLTTRLVSMLKRTGVPIIMHICGNTSDRLSSLAETGVDCLSLDEKVDFAQARAELGEDYLLMGNVSTTTLATGKPEEVTRAARRVLEQAGRGGRLFLSGGCMISEIMPAENMRALVRAARDFAL